MKEEKKKRDRKRENEMLIYFCSLITVQVLNKFYRS